VLAAGTVWCTISINRFDLGAATALAGAVNELVAQLAPR
jgi:hypothetical protein